MSGMSMLDSCCSSIGIPTSITATENKKRVMKVNVHHSDDENKNVFIKCYDQASVCMHCKLIICCLKNKKSNNVVNDCHKETYHCKSACALNQ